MADEADKAEDLIEKQMALRIADARSHVIEPGYAGECYKCGEESKRLIKGACAPCRDKFKLP